MPYAAGTFDFPQSTGAFSVTGVGFQPELVVMFGSNQSSVDTLLTGVTRPGLFLCISARDYDGSGIKSFSISIAGNTGSLGSALGYTRYGDGHIRMQGTGGDTVIDYRSSAISFDSDGFTITVSHAAPGTRPISWWAVDSEGQGLAANWGNDIAGTFDTDFPIRSFIGLNGPASGGAAEATTGTDSWLHFGTSHYPSNAITLNTRQSAVTHTGCLPTSSAGRQGFTEQFFFNGPNGNRLCFDISAVGPAIVDGYVTVIPDVLGGDQAVIANAGSITDQTIVVWTGIDGVADEVVTDADIGDVVSVATPSWFNEFSLVMFSTINGTAETLTTATLRYGLGVLHPDYQGCVVMGDDGSFFQSTTQCAANCSASGASTVEGTIPGPTFELETMSGGSFHMAYHAFGPVREAAWMPQIYRVVTV